jgi:hypothetical protein
MNRIPVTTPLLLAVAMLVALCTRAEAQAVPSAAEVARAHEVLRLSMRREDLLDKNRNYVVLPAIAAAVGVATVVVGGVVFARAWSEKTTTCSAYACSTSGGYNETMDLTGMAMMTVGGHLIALGATIFGIRLSRARRLERISRQLERLGERVALAPSRTGKGASMRLQF